MHRNELVLLHAFGHKQYQGQYTPEDSRWLEEYIINREGYSPRGTKGCKMSTSLQVFWRNSAWMPRDATMQHKRPWYALRSFGMKGEIEPGSMASFGDEEEALD